MDTNMNTKIEMPNWSIMQWELAYLSYRMFKSTKDLTMVDIYHHMPTHHGVAANTGYGRVTYSHFLKMVSLLAIEEWITITHKKPDTRLNFITPTQKLLDFFKR